MRSDVQNNSYNRRDIFAIAAFLILVLIVWTVLFALPSPTETQLADESTQELSRLDFSHTIYSTIRGWASYPEKLYTPADFANGAAADPSRTQDEMDYGRIQYATHRLLFRLAPGKTYGLLMKSADYAMRIFIDGEEIDSVGIPGETREATVPRTLKRVYYFTTLSGEVDVIMQAANFVHREGAYPPKIFIGTAENIARKNDGDLFKSCALFFCLLTASLYHFGLYLINRSRKAALLFSVCCMLLSFLNYKTILDFIPDYNWFFAIRFEYINHYLIFTAFLLFLETLQPGLLRKGITRSFYVLSGLYVVTTLLLDPKIFTLLLYGFEAAAALMAVYVLVRLATNMRQKSIQNALTFAGTLIVVLPGVFDIFIKLQLFRIENTTGLEFATPLGMVFMVFCYALAVALDYADTERAYTEAQRKALLYLEENTLLDRLNKLKTEFLGNLSHELKTPLAVISSHAQLTRRHEEEKDEPDDYTIHKMLLTASEAERLAAMVSRLSDISRIEENRMEWHIDETDLVGLIHETMDTFFPVLNKNHNTIHTDLPDCFPKVLCDAERVKQILLNLVSNAIRFTQRGVITLSIRAENERAAITVSDTGKGIENDRIQYIFDRYFSEETGTASTGTGLGLYITKRLVEAQNGTITIESEPGKGTAVTFTLPLAANPKEGTHESNRIAG